MPRFPLLTVLPALAAMISALPYTAAAAGVQPGYVSAVLIGVNDPSGILPTFDKVPGTSTDNLDVALPTSVLTRGKGYVVMVMSQVATFSGTCDTSYELKQTVTGSAVVLARGAVKPYACSNDQIFGLALGTRKIAGVAGPATLTGTVTFGTQKIRLNVPVLLQ